MTQFIYGKKIIPLKLKKCVSYEHVFYYFLLLLLDLFSYIPVVNVGEGCRSLPSQKCDFCCYEPYPFKAILFNKYQ